MPNLPDINSASLYDDPGKRLDAVTRQVNDAFRLITNESITTVYNDNSGTPRIIIGVLPDGDTGIVISQEGTSVLDVFD